MHFAEARSPMQATPPAHASRQMILVRHGATAPNLAGLRCGGDLDVPLTELGRRQAEHAALCIREFGTPVGVIFASHLQRTRETAQIIGHMLGGVEVVIEPAFTERRLGVWNLRSVAETQVELAAGVTPHGGESNAEFLERIAGAVDTLRPHLPRRPLVVGSKGVARVLRELLGLPNRKAVANGEVMHFDLAALSPRDRAGCHA
jgi:2,3-bisphosphoglycerate-dependent phosphoglycerate mutase